MVRVLDECFLEVPLYLGSMDMFNRPSHENMGRKMPRILLLREG